MASLLARLPSHGMATIVLFFGVGLVYFITAEYRADEGVNDTLFTLLPAWSLSEFGNPNLENLPTARPLQPWAFFYDGHVRSDRFPGAIFLALPFYWLLGDAEFSMEPGISSAVFATTLSIAFLHRTLLRIVGPTVALATCLVAAFGTTLWTVAADQAWTHAPSILGLSIGAWGMSRGSWIGAGLGYALAIFSRPHNAIVAAIVGLWQGIRDRSVMVVLKVGVASALGFAGLLAWNNYNAGQWTLLPGTYATRVDASVSTGAGGQATADMWFYDLVNTLFSPLRGILVYSPFIAVLLLGVVAAWRVSQPWVRSGAVAGVVYLVIQLAGNTWNGGAGFFGYRISLETVYLCVPLGAMAWTAWVSKHQWARYAFGVLLAISLWWFALGGAAFTVDVTQSVRPDDWAVSMLVGVTGPVAWILAALFVVACFEIVRRYDAVIQAGEAVAARAAVSDAPVGADSGGDAATSSDSANSAAAPVAIGADASVADAVEPDGASSDAVSSDAGATSGRDVTS
jgi:hypothetical protein